MYAEQVRSSYAHLPLTLTVSVLNSVLLGFVLASGVSQARIVTWIGLVVGLSAIRFALLYAYSRLDVGPRHSRWWTRFAAIEAFVSGVLWGSGVFFFAPLDESQLLFLALVISGMCAGAATVHAAHFPTVIAFILPAILPLTLNFLAQGNRLQVVSGVMAGIFGISLCVASLRFQQWFRDTTSARLTLASQTLEINEANTRLKNEMARHRSTEIRLQHAQKMEAIGRLTAGIAHDFNNLLLSIGGSAEVLMSRIGLDSVHSRLVATILQSVERGTNLTRQLLVFGRRQTLLPRFVDINEMLLGMEELLVTTLGGHASLELQLDRALPATVFVDTNQLENSILNLVLNARDAMLNGGSVTIKAANVELRDNESATEGLSGRYVVISVSDTGTGMTEQVRLRAFDPFFTTKEIGKGSGLGLSQVYGLVQQSGGIIRLDSQPGDGTTVSIYLPKAPSPAVSLQATPNISADATPAAIASDGPREGRRILLLDDDEQVRETVTEMLMAAGYTVASFGIASQALDELSRPHRIDLIIVDFAMPEISGDQFAAAARSRRSEVPVLLITGYAETESLQSERWVLRKPFDVASLISTVEDAMRIAA
ncbi:MAG TPA: ATP-binding protein [Acetobacteraceae bacterium]|nr:ATP-binding protein [Acetobacteraceae bacterium]